MCLALASSSPYQPRLRIVARDYNPLCCSIENVSNRKDWLIFEKIGCPAACVAQLCVSSPVLVCEIVAI